jgi:Ca2+ transporting ATPase
MESLIPSDIIYVMTDDKTSTDARILSINFNAFRINQVILMGESISVSKEVAVLPDTQAAKQNQINILLKASPVF